jgi:hypothetical protein
MERLRREETMKIYTLLIDGEWGGRGPRVTSHWSETKAKEDLADYVRRNWESMVNCVDEKTECPTDDDEAIALYFELVGEESYRLVSSETRNIEVTASRDELLDRLHDAVSQLDDAQLQQLADTAERSKPGYAPGRVASGYRPPE